jgi:uncharacterized membrane protein (DUF4010 family)
LVYQDSFYILASGIANYIPLLADILHHLPVYIVALFSGLADVDAITQQMSELSNGSGLTPLPSIAATTAIIIALVTNTAVKI